MFKKYLIHGIVSGIVAATAATIYDRVYYFITYVDYSRVLNVPRIVSLNILFCIIAAFLNWFLAIRLKQRAEIVFNFLFSALSVGLMIIPISIALPLDVGLPELFPGLAVPMALFPALSWYTIAPFFREKG
jgi:uncharacterized membrane protein YedE/YeeE